MKPATKVEKQSVEQLCAEITGCLVEIELYQLPSLEGKLKLVRDICEVGCDLVDKLKQKVIDEEPQE